MDASTQQAKVDQLTAQVQTDQAALQTDQTALNEAQAELAHVTFINQLEALSPDDIATINAALASDPDNHSGINLSTAVPNETPAA